MTADEAKADATEYVTAWTDSLLEQKGGGG